MDFTIATSENGKHNEKHFIINQLSLSDFTFSPIAAMKKTILVIIFSLVVSHSLILMNGYYNLNKGRVYKLMLDSMSAPSSSSNNPISSMRIRIHGTKNAYTTIRSNDIVLYQLENEVDGLERAVGLYRNGLIYPLLAKDAKRDVFLIDSKVDPLDAEVLGRKNRILRMVSSDAFSGLGKEAFKVDEYIDDTVYVKLYDERASETVNISSLKENDRLDPNKKADNVGDDVTNLLLAELNVAKLELKVCFIYYESYCLV
jgi:hypothetical protein